MPDEPAPTSPRMERLSADIKRNRASALPAFWKKLDAQGSPIIELDPADSSQALVTFVWRGDARTTSVTVRNDDLFSGPDSALERLGDTELWHRTYRLPADIRFEYVFAPNDPELTGGTYGSAREKAAALRTDPLNPKRYLIPDDGEHPEWDDFFRDWSTWVQREQSLVELPTAPAQPWAVEHDDVPQGRFDKHRLESKTLGNSRVIYVYTPHGYDGRSEPERLLVLSDGWAYATFLPIRTILDNLIADGSIPPLVAVLVDHPTLVARGAELAHPPPGPGFVEFMAGELLSWVHERYRVTTDPARSIIAGASNGGDTAAKVAFAHPHLFGCVLSQSGTYGGSPADDPEPEWFARHVAESPLLPIRFYLDAGSMETQPGEQSKIGILQSNRHLRTVLRAKGYDVLYQEFSGGHQPMCWAGTMRDALVWLTAA